MGSIPPKTIRQGMTSIISRPFLAFSDGWSKTHLQCGFCEAHLAAERTGERVLGLTRCQGRLPSEIQVAVGPAGKDEKETSGVD